MITMNSQNFKYFNIQHSTFNISSGFTLMEVLVSLAVLSIALVAVFHSNIGLENVTITTEEEIKASLLAQNIMAHILAFGIDKYDQFPMEIEKQGFEYDVQVDATDIENFWRVKIIISKDDATIYQKSALLEARDNG